MSIICLSNYLIKKLGVMVNSKRNYIYMFYASFHVEFSKNCMFLLIIMFWPWLISRRFNSKKKKRLGIEFSSSSSLCEIFSKGK